MERPIWKKASWNIKEEADALTAFIVRLAWSETMEGYDHVDALSEPKSVCRIKTDEFKSLLQNSAAKMHEMMIMKENDPNEYWDVLSWMDSHHCKDWTQN